MKRSSLIKAWRAYKGLSQQELAEMLGVRRSTVTDWESGKHDPHDMNLRRVAEILNVDYTLFLSGPESPLVNIHDYLGKDVSKYLDVYSKKTKHSTERIIFSSLVAFVLKDDFEKTQNLILGDYCETVLRNSSYLSRVPEGTRQLVELFLLRVKMKNNE